METQMRWNRAWTASRWLFTFALSATLAACTATPPATTATAPSDAAARTTETAAPEPMLDAEWRDEVLYFVIVDRFANGDTGNDRNVDPTARGTFHGGDLAGLTAQLPYLADLGVTALWITPVVEQIPGYVTGAGFPDWAYHGYWADDFYAVDDRFGSEAELAALVAEAHRRGIKVLLDVVYNHPGYDTHYLEDPRTGHWLRSEQRGNCGADDLTTCLIGLPDFRTELPEVRRYLLDAHLGLAARVGLDGFRLDTVKHVEHDFWRQHRREVDARLGGDFFLLGEVWGGDGEVLDPWFEPDELDAGFDFSFQGSALAFVQGRGRPVAFGRYLEKRQADTRDGHLLAHFLSSHDVPGALYQLGGDVARFRLAAVLQLTTWGLPTIYYGEEVARDGGDWPANRSDMPWGERGVLPGSSEPRDEALHADYRKLIALRSAHPALWRGGHATVDAGADHLVFARSDGESGETMLVAVNRSEAAAELEFDAPAGWSGPVHDLWNDAAATLAGGRLKVVVPALGAAILAAGGGRGGG